MISKFKPETEFYTEERCYIVEIHNRGEDEGCSIVSARVAPGVTKKLHAVRGIVERYVILEGEGLVEVGGAVPSSVRPLDVVVITAGTSQRITNVGAVAGLESLFGWGDIWREKRMAAELIKSEGFSFLQLTGDYAQFETHQKAYKRFAQNVEELIRHEIKDYIVAVSPKPETKSDSASG